MQDVQGAFHQHIDGTTRMLRSNVVPAAVTTVHRYTALQYSFGTPGTGLNTAAYYLCSNDVYRPDFTGGILGPHQPYGYDQMRNFYLNATVIKAKVSVRMISGTSENAALIVFAKQQLDSADPAGQTAVQWVEKPNSWVLGGPTANRPQYTWEADFDIAKIIGVSRQKLLEEDDYSCIGNSSPQSGAPTVLVGFSTGNTATGAGVTIQCIISIDYTVVWRNTVTNPSS